MIDEVRIRRRPGMTLIELLVAMSIIVLLAGMLVAFWPGVQEQQRSADAGALVENWLRVAKARAFRDGRIRGLRLYMNNVGNPYQVTSCQFLDQPDDFFVPGSFIASPLMTGTTISFSTPGVNPTTGAAIPVDFFQGQAGDPVLWAVQPGDSLELNGVGQRHQIVGVPNAVTLKLAPVLSAVAAPIPGPVLPTDQIPITLLDPVTLATLNPAVLGLTVGCYLDLDINTNFPDTVQVTAISGTTVTVTGMQNAHNLGPTVLSHCISVYNSGPGTSYRVMRAPRAVGDEQLKLPDSIVIDLSLTQAAPFPFPLPPGNNYSISGGSIPFNVDASGNATVDVLFSASGAMVTPGTVSDFVVLWVRDLNGNSEFDLGPTLIAVHVRSGLIATHPPSNFAGNPYQFIIDGRVQ